MLSHCANPQCASPFLRLGQGKLFLVEADSSAQPVYQAPGTLSYARRSPRHLERYWLCRQCAEVSTLVHDTNRGIVLLPLPRTLAVPPGVEKRA